MFDEQVVDWSMYELVGADVSTFGYQLPD